MLNAENMLLISDWQQTERGVTILQADIQKFIEYCNRILDFSNIDAQYSYKSLPVCVIDCVYSLRAQYFSTTVPVVDRYAEMYLQGDKFTSVSCKTNKVFQEEERRRSAMSWQKRCLIFFQ